MHRLILLLALPLFGQTPDLATLHGRVTDPSHAAAAGASVSAANTVSGVKRTVLTDAQGGFQLAGLPVAGEYTVTATRQGFAAATVGGITLAAGTTADIHLELSVAPGQAQVTITGAVGEVRTDGPQLGNRLSAEQIESTPLLSRRISYLPLLNAANRPVINQGDVFINQDLFTTNGAGRRQPWFEVDGATNNDSWGRQTQFTNLPASTVQEMTILENVFTAEYGGGVGSAVNVVTRSGSNQLHGELLELWRPSATEAALSGFTSTNAASGNDLTNDTLGQTAAMLSGPVGASGRTHFAAAGELNREDKASPITSPVAPGNFIGHYRGWLGFLRLDHDWNANNHLFFRSNLDGFHDTNPNGAVGGNNLPSVDRVFRRRTYSQSLGETAILSPSLVNNVRLQFQLASPITQFDPVIYGTQFVVPISTGGTFTSGTSQSALLLNRQYQFNDTLSWVQGKHQLRFGADSITAHTGGNSKEFGGPIYLGQFSYNTCTQALADCESSAYLGNIANVKSYTQSYGNASYTVNDTIWALFVQDDYRVRQDLTINIGLRYEQQTFTDARKSFAPRVGFSYNVNGDGRTVIRGGFGIYYSQIIDNAAANYALTGPTGVFNYTAAPGQIGFPSTVASAPLPAFPAGAQVPLRSLYVRPGNSAYLNQFFPTSVLGNYPQALLNPYSQQWSFGVERRLATDWVLSMDYVGSHAIRIVRPLDVDAPAPFIRTAPGQVRTAQAANCTRPYWISWYEQHNLTCSTTSASNPQPPYSVIQTDVNNGYSFYHALDLNLTRRFRNGVSLLASYTWSHTITNVDQDSIAQNPNDANFTGKVENGNALFDQRQRFVLSGVYEAPFKIRLGGVATLATGLPYNYVTGVNNSGDTGATTDRPVINGVVVSRNAGRGTAIYDLAPFIERNFGLWKERVRMNLRLEAFNVINHANFVGFSGTYGNAATAGAGFGAPLAGITNQMPARSLQFVLKFSF
jgi:hypothetical protein